MVLITLGCLVALIPVTLGAEAVGDPLVFSTPSGSPGDSVTVTGDGWDPAFGEVNVFVSEDDSTDPSKNPLFSATPTVDGAISALMSVPELPADSYTFFACQACFRPSPDRSATATFAIIPSRSLTLLPTEGSPGDVVAVSGEGWDIAFKTASVFASKADSTDPSKALMSANPGDGGVLSGELDVPELPSGTYTFFACQDCGQQSPNLAATAIFTINPSRTLTLLPTEGPPGDSVAVSGEGWDTRFDTVSIFASQADSIDPTKTLTTANPGVGGVLSGKLDVPQLPAGSYTFLACQDCGRQSPGLSATAVFTITLAPTRDRTLVILPTEGSPGDSVAVSGEGWDVALGMVSVFAGQADTPDPTKALMSASPGDGGVLSGQLDVPQLPAGTYILYACQVCSRPSPALSATAIFTIIPSRSLTLLPTEGSRGDVVAVSGEGWDIAFKTVSVFASKADSTDPSKALTTANPGDGGVLSGELDVPELPSGTYTFFACQDCGQQSPQLAATATFTVAPAPAAELLVDPVGGKPGDRVTVSGSDWSPVGGLVRVFADPSDASDPANAVLLADVDRNGGFSASVTVPMQDPGVYELFACQDCGNPNGFPSAQVTFTLAARPSSSFPVWILILAGVVVVLAVASVLIARSRGHLRRGSAKPRLKGEPDLSFDVESTARRDGALPTIRLVPVDDESDIAERVEIRP